MKYRIKKEITSVWVYEVEAEDEDQALDKLEEFDETGESAEVEEVYYYEYDGQFDIKEAEDK